MPNEQANGGVALGRTVGPFTAIAMIAGLMIGSGIFVSPVGVLHHVESIGAALVVWAASGLAAFIGSMCYAELGAMMPLSGGDYHYIGRAFGVGGLVQFLYMWAMLFVVQPGNRAIIALTFATYLLKLVFPDCEPPSHAVVLVAAFAIVLLSVVNCINIKAVGRLQDFFMITKCLALLSIIVTGLVVLGQGKDYNLRAVFESTSQEPVNWAKAIYNGVFTYSGWNYLNSVAEEVKNPFRTIPRGLWISVPLVTLLYLLTNFAFFIVLTPREMLTSPAVAMTFGNKMFGVMSWIIPLFVACSTFGGLNGLTYMPSRLYFVAAREGHLPRFFQTVNTELLTPVPSLIVQCAITLAILSTGEVLKLIGYVSIVEVSFVGISVAGLLHLRRIEPQAPRPVKISIFFPVAYLAFSIFLLLLTVHNGAFDSLAGVGLTLTGVPAYLIFVAWKTRKPKLLAVLMRSFTVIVQKLLYVAPESRPHDGGGQRKSGRRSISGAGCSVVGKVVQH